MIKTNETSLTDEKRNPIGVICFLAWPAILEQLFLTLVNYVDTAMVGAIGNGTDAGAAIGVIAPYTWMINGMFSALGTGFSVFVGRAFGAGDYAYAKKVIRQGVMAACCLGLFFTILIEIAAPFIPDLMGADPSIGENSTKYLRFLALGYTFSSMSVMAASVLRCAGDTRTPFVCNVLMNLMNVCLNFLLIFETRTITLFDGGVELLGISVPEVSFRMWGAGLGVAGAAAASAMSLTVMGLVMLSRLFFKKYPARISIREDWKPDKQIMSSSIRLALPVAGERVTQNLGQIAMTALVTGIGTAALAAHNYAITAESITYMPAFGFTAAATTLVAQSLGAKKAELASRFGRLCILSGVIFMSVVGVLLFLFSYDLVGIFSSDPEVIELGGSVLRIEAFAQPFFALQMVAAGALRGAGDTKMPFVYTVIGMWGVRVVTAVLLIRAFDFGLYGAWIAMVANIVVSGTLMLIRFARNRWTKNEKAFSLYEGNDAAAQN